MKIMVIGSMAFAKEMVKTKQTLEAMGHDVAVPADIETHLANEGFVDDLDGNLQYATETDIMRQCFGLVAASEAVLVLNHPRKGIQGYIGTSALMEIGIAYYLGKKIFLLHAVPHYNEVRWAHEITIINPTIIQGDLNKIK